LLVEQLASDVDRLESPLDLLLDSCALVDKEKTARSSPLLLVGQRRDPDTVLLDGVRRDVRA